MKVITDNSQQAAEERDESAIESGIIVERVEGSQWKRCKITNMCMRLYIQ